VAVPTLVEQNRSEKRRGCFLESHYARVTTGCHHERVATHWPEARLLKLVKDLATEVEELKDEHGKSEHAKKIFVANGLPGYFGLLSNTVIEGRAPSTHLFYKTLHDKLVNNTRLPNGQRFCPEILQLSAIARLSQSGQTALEYIKGTGSGYSISKFYELPDPSYM